MNTLIVLVSAFFSGLLLGRLADLMLKDPRLGLPWLFGPVVDAYDDEVRLLTYCSAATMAAAAFALNEGVNVIWPILVTPFVFNWMSALLLLAHRAVGPAFEDAVIRLHPVDLAYDLFKLLMTSMWARGRSSISGGSHDEESIHTLAVSEAEEEAEADVHADALHGASLSTGHATRHVIGESPLPNASN